MNSLRLTRLLPLPYLIILGKAVAGSNGIVCLSAYCPEEVINTHYSIIMQHIYIKEWEGWEGAEAEEALKSLVIGPRMAHSNVSRLEESLTHRIWSWLKCVRSLLEQYLKANTFILLAKFLLGEKKKPCSNHRMDLVNTSFLLCWQRDSEGSRRLSSEHCSLWLALGTGSWRTLLASEQGGLCDLQIGVGRRRARGPD